MWPTNHTNDTNLRVEENSLIYGDECFAIMGCCFNVYNEMGAGFLESVYQECLAIEFAKSNVPFKQQARIQLAYREHVLVHEFQADFICHDKILVELKAVSGLAGEHRAQVLNYLHASQHRLGLLVNFGHFPKLQYERIVL